MSKAARSILVFGINLVVLGSDLMIPHNFLSDALRTADHQQDPHSSAGFGDHHPRILLPGGCLS